MTWSSQSRITKTVESLQIIGLQARVNAESNESPLTPAMIAGTFVATSR